MKRTLLIALSGIGYFIVSLILFLPFRMKPIENYNLVALPSFSLAQQHQGAKILILYYSLTGNTKASCEALQTALGTDILKVKDLRNRSGKWGFFKTAIASLIGRPTKIEPEHPNLSSYSFIILGFPIWTGKLSMAIRTLVDRNRFDGKKVVIFTTTNAYEKEKYKEKSRSLVRRAGGEVVGYYQVLASEEREGKKVGTKAFPDAPYGALAG